MNRNAEAITIFCSHLCVAEGICPLEPKEWSDLVSLLRSRDLQPEYLLDFGEADFRDQFLFSETEAIRCMRLLDRSGSLRFELSKYEDMGIHVVTRADPDYPRQLKKKLGNGCPPLFYSAGDLDLLNRESVGYAGSRSIDPSDIAFTTQAVAKTAGLGYAVVSGGAKGIDSISSSAAIAEGTVAIEYLSDSMLRKMRDNDLVSKIRDGRILLMSSAIPTAGFNVGMAMARNRYIYAQSSGTVVIHSDKGKGGTWAGATENLKKSLCPTFCRDCDFPGNRELIRLGAIPIDETWDGDVTKSHLPAGKPDTRSASTDSEKQLAFFDL